MAPKWLQHRAQAPPKTLLEPSWRRTWSPETFFHVFDQCWHFFGSFFTLYAVISARVFLSFSGRSVASILSSTLFFILFFVRAQEDAHPESTGRADTFSMFFKVRSRTGATTMKAKSKGKKKRKDRLSIFCCFYVFL